MIVAQNLKHLGSEPLVSIIVPVYKVEKYIDRCVKSIIAQTYKNTEVFLVDDGSPDNCGKICDEYAEKYPCIHVIHQENAGQAAARNNAVKQANGDFISFIDSDDFVEPDYIEYLVTLQQKSNADMSIGGFAYIYDGKKFNERTLENEAEEVLGALDILVRMNYNYGCGATPWAKLYRKELIVRHPFPEGQIYEDLATLYKIVGDCSTIAIGTRRIYYWVQHAGSTMRMEFDERQMAGIDAAADQLCYVERYFPEAVPAAKARYMGKIIELMSLAMNGKDAKRVYQMMREKMYYYHDVMSDSKVKKTQKVRLLAMHLGYIPSKIIFSVHESMKRVYFN